MSADTKIEWCHATFSPWRGCQRVSPGCEHCYAETLSARNPSVLGTWGPNGSRVIASESYWRQPLAWDRAAAKAGERRRVFCASLADVFEDREELVPSRHRLFRLIKATPWLDWLLLTKRPEIAHRLLPVEAREHGEHAFFPNVWLGVSVEDQQRADERIPVLLDTPAAVRFLSIEPMLGPVDLGPKMCCDGRDCACMGKPTDLPLICGGSCDNWIDWVIVGGESGPGARPCDIAWVRSIVAQCRAAGVACFVKQLGSVVGGLGLSRAEVRMRSKGGDPDEWPEDLRVREFPKEEGP